MLNKPSNGPATRRIAELQGEPTPRSGGSPIFINYLEMKPV